MSTKGMSGEVSEKDVTLAILSEWSERLKGFVEESDVIVAGAGPSGLVCAEGLLKAV